MSSKVMNMKFMQRDAKSAPSSSKNDRVKIIDPSQWALPNAPQLIQNARPKIQTIGYSDINNITLRSKWGSPQEQEKPEEKIDLDDILKAGKRKKSGDKKKSKKQKKDK
ncbi:hypothetical protein DICA2_C15984 [Diutina catenulata]